MEVDFLNPGRIQKWTPQKNGESFGIVYTICGLFSHYNSLLYQVTSSSFFIEEEPNEREHLSKLLLCIIVFILL